MQSRVTEGVGVNLKLKREVDDDSDDFHRHLPLLDLVHLRHDLRISGSLRTYSSTLPLNP